jgi:hypothetical protein
MNKTVFVPNGRWASSTIRGEQVAEKLGARFGYDLRDCDNVVFVKCMDNKVPLKMFKNVYLDLVDSDGFLPLLQANPEIKVIVTSSMGGRYVSARIQNRVVVIPEHHCNFERSFRTRKEVTTVGYVGSASCLDLSVIVLKEEFAKIGLDFVWLFVDGVDITRKDICDFYKKIDIQLSFRLPRLLENMPPELKNCLKLTNAGSFGIPTIGYPELCWDEFGCGFVAAGNVNDLTTVALALKDKKDFYNTVASQAFEKAQAYHIDEIATLYEEILK